VVCGDGEGVGLVHMSVTRERIRLQEQIMGAVHGLCVVVCCLAALYSVKTVIPL